MSGQNFTGAKPIGKLTPKQPSDGLIVMPERIDDEGVGYYGAQAPTLYKDLSAMGAEVSYYTDKRKSIHRFSADEVGIAAFVVAFFVDGVLPAATYDVLKAYLLSKFKKKPGGKIRGKVLIASKANEYSTWQEYDVSGSVDDAIKMIDKIQEIHGNGDSSSEKGT